LREDMHDMIGSRLVRIASLARQASPENNEEVLARIHDMTIVTVRSLRNLLTLMSESTMTDQDFFGSMREYVAESCKDARIDCSIDVNVDDTTSLDNAGRHELLMIISEMLTNTIRHSSATRVEFAIHSDNQLTIITWADNGLGIDPDAKRGNGLHNIERRAKRIHALVAIDTA
ncbi:MAG: sensor histidine kinase, partial [Ignavibacteria bacterium]